MQAKDIMVAGANVIAVCPDDSIYTAIRLMLKQGISGLPVVERGPLDTRTLVGIVTEGDFLRRRETKTLRRRPSWLEFLVGPGRLAEEYARASGCKIQEIMTTPVATVTENASIEDVVLLMEQRHVKRVPVVRGGTLVGIITRANLLRALVHEAGKNFVPTSGDAEIKDRLLEELKKQPWGTALVEVNVTNGTVKLTGAITDERERAAFVIAAENIPGVRTIEDHISFVEPLSGMVIAPPADDRHAKAS